MVVGRDKESQKPVAVQVQTHPLHGMYKIVDTTKIIL